MRTSSTKLQFKQKIQTKDVFLKKCEILDNNVLSNIQYDYFL